MCCDLTCRAKEVLRDLKSVVKSTDAAESYAMGFGLGFRVMGVKAGKGRAVHPHSHPRYIIPPCSSSHKAWLLIYICMH